MVEIAHDCPRGQRKVSLQNVVTMSEKVLIEKIECTGCGVCVTICPHKVIDIVDGKAEICLDCFLCGHCQAVCPEKAISLPQLPVQLGLRTVKEKNTIVPPGKTDSSELIALMRSRRSCRNYLDKAVDLAVLEDLVKVGITAPSGTNSQSWSFALIPKRADLQVFGGAVADYYRRLNRLALNPLLRLVMKIGGGDSLGRYYRNYYSSVAKALRDWDDEGIDRLFHGAAAAICVGGKKKQAARQRMPYLPHRIFCSLLIPWGLVAVSLVLLLRQCVGRIR